MEERPLHGVKKGARFEKPTRRKVNRRVLDPANVDDDQGMAVMKSDGAQLLLLLSAKQFITPEPRSSPIGQTGTGLGLSSPRLEEPMNFSGSSTLWA